MKRNAMPGSRVDSDEVTASAFGCLGGGARLLGYVFIWWLVRSLMFLIVALAVSGLVVLLSSQSWTNALWFGILVAIVIMGVYIFIIEPFVDLLRAGRKHDASD